MNEILQTARQVKEEKPDAGDQLAVKLSFPVDGSPDNSKTPDKAEAKVTQDKHLQPDYWVQLKISNSTATFFDAGPDTGKQVTTLKTGTDGRVHAKFVNDVAGSGTMTATIVRRRNGDAIKNGPSDTKTFSFVHDYKLGISIEANNSPADSLTQNKVSANFTEGSIPRDGTIVFKLVGSCSASFVDTGDQNIVKVTDKEIWVKADSRGDATADFVDDNTSGEDVIVTAAVQGIPDLNPDPQSLKFTFKPVHPYSNIFLFPQSNDANADSVQRNKIQALLTKDLLPIDGTIVFTLPEDKSAIFVDPKDSYTTYINPKKIKVKTHADLKGSTSVLLTDSNSGGETVILKALSENTRPGAQSSVFNPAGSAVEYGVKFFSLPNILQTASVYASVTRTVASDDSVWVRFSLDKNSKTVFLLTPHTDKYKWIDNYTVEVKALYDDQNIDTTSPVTAFCYSSLTDDQVGTAKVTVEVVGHEKQAHDSGTILFLPAQDDPPPELNSSADRDLNAQK